MEDRGWINPGSAYCRLADQMKARTEDGGSRIRGRDEDIPLRLSTRSTKR